MRMYIHTYPHLLLLTFRGHYFVHCTDVNECTTDKHNCFSVGYCINTAGSFICNCPKGYSKQSDGYTCTGSTFFSFIVVVVTGVKKSVLGLQMQMSVTMEITTVSVASTVTTMQVVIVAAVPQDTNSRVTWPHAQVKNVEKHNAMNVQWCRLIVVGLFPSCRY